MRKLLVLLLALALSACAAAPQQAQRTAIFDLTTVPEGAVVYFGEKAIGVTPMQVSMPLNDWNIANGQVWTTLNMKWVSGASISRKFTVTFAQGATKVKGSPLTVQRPTNAPNLAADLQYAENRQRERQQQMALARQKAQEDSAATAGLFMVMLGAASGLAQGYSQNRTSSTSLNCTSQRDGDTTRTNCY